MKKIIALGLASSCLLLTRGQALAWNAAGHRVVAAIAYQALPDADKANVFTLLQQHPNWSNWVSHYSTDVPGGEIDLPTFVFIRASTWADEIRNSTDPFKHRFDHAEWHYVDYPLWAPAFPDLPRPTAFVTNDVLYAVDQCRTALADTNASPADRAAYLALLIHYIGDLHQPLHCAELYTADQFPNGDRGGNAFFIKQSSTSQPENLHHLWDAALGTNQYYSATEYQTTHVITSEHPRSSFPQLASDTTVESWCLEGRALAITETYQFRGALLSAGTNASTAVLLPFDYVTNRIAVAYRCAALAGYRLTDELHRFFAVTNSTNLPPAVLSAASPTFGPAPLTVSFSSTGTSDPEGATLTYQWNFGDGTTSSTTSPMHVYPSNGIYKVRLTVSDGVNSVTTTNVTISVRPVPPPPTNLKVQSL